MVFKLYSDVRETSVTGGTGDQVLAGAFDAGYFRFGDRYSNADTFFYCMKQGTAREIGLGTRVTSGDKIARTQVFKSTNSNNLVSFTNGQTIDIFVSNIAPDDLDAAGKLLLAASLPLLLNSVQTLSAAEQAQVRSNISAMSSTAAARGHIFGLTMSNNATDATNDIDIAAGDAASTETNPVLMVLASAITKRLDAAWAVGSGNGGRMSAAAIADGTYHMWLIQRSDTGVVDVGFDASATSPTMPANYDRKRYIGAVIRAAGALRTFRQVGDKFYHKTVVPEFSAGTTPTTTAVTWSLVGVPSGRRVEAILSGFYADTTAGTAMYLSSLDDNDVAASGGNATASGGGSSALIPWAKNVWSNAAAQVRVRFSAITPTFYVNTMGWIDRRGRDD